MTNNNDDDEKAPIYGILPALRWLQFECIRAGYDGMAGLLWPVVDAGVAVQADLETKH